MDDKRFPHTTAGTLAQQLGWFSIALGTLELVATRRLTRALGMWGQERTLQAYGVREIVTGIGILTSKDPAPWVWGRVAGDALDLGTMAMAYPNNPKKAKLAMAIANVAAVTALDVICAQQLSATKVRQQMPVRDYSDRSGLPMGISASRGAASDAEMTEQFRIPEPLRPFDATV
ncbi:MAG: cyclase dehydrase [Cyanobacteria bacterium]|nr:cyclase dehydrase [Cyanobacteriota bacterium]